MDILLSFYVSVFECLCLHVFVLYMLFLLLFFFCSSSLETFQIPFVAGEKDLVVLICNSDVRHELSDSEYPTRRKQCSEALKLMGLKSYRDATEGNLSGN